MSGVHEVCVNRRTELKRSPHSCFSVNHIFDLSKVYRMSLGVVIATNPFDATPGSTRETEGWLGGVGVISDVQAREYERMYTHLIEVPETLSETDASLFPDIQPQ